MEDKTPTGILTDITKYLDQQMPDYTFKIELYPWARAYENAVEGKERVIRLIHDSRTPENIRLFRAGVLWQVAIVVLKGQEFLLNGSRI